MTDAEIEQIARLYCRKLGLDPNLMQMDPLSGCLMPTWKIYATEVREALAMSEAIAEVRATVTEGGV